MMDNRNDYFTILKDFLSYHETIKGQSKRTINEYYLDLRMFFRFMKLHKGIVSADTELEDISISDIDIEFIKSISMSDVYEYMSFLSNDRVKNSRSRYSENGIGSAARARKVSSIRSFYKYLTNKVQLLDENPMADLEYPRLRKTLPRYLSLDDSVKLLTKVDGQYKERDFAILMIFLSCGLRISELVSLNISDYRGDHLRVLGKGNKERIVYLNDNCIDAIDEYLDVRPNNPNCDPKALFLSKNYSRITKSGVHYLVKKHIGEAGLDTTQYSTHKLRHTAATLMLDSGVDVRTLQEVLGHENLNTTEIYTHVDNDGLRVAAKANPLGKVKFENKE
ncbi:MAG: tyrosine recombinase XerC [Ruminococcaceae bacterium]|nr:tyrosine recombinase XerC [Oscillospiraceae bacterium]